VQRCRVQRQRQRQQRRRQMDRGRIDAMDRRTDRWTDIDGYRRRAVLMAAEVQTREAEAEWCAEDTDGR
jgi:hypothetical protein